MNRKSHLVYTTDQGKIKPSLSSDSPSQMKSASEDGIVRIQRETKGRKGKGVTCVRGIPGDETQLNAIAKQLKQLCGCGGCVKAGIIEIQGDQRHRLKTSLEAQGYHVKLVGG